MRRDLINFFSRFKESYHNKLIFSSITVLAGPVHIFYPAAAFTVNFFFLFFAWVGSVSDSCPMTTPITSDSEHLPTGVRITTVSLLQTLSTCTYTVLHLSRRLTRGDRRLGSAPLHSGPFIHGSLISQSLCFNSEDKNVSTCRISIVFVRICYILSMYW